MTSDGKVTLDDKMGTSGKNDFKWLGYNHPAVGAIKIQKEIPYEKYFNFEKGDMNH